MFKFIKKNNAFKPIKIRWIFTYIKNNLTKLHFFADEGEKVRQDSYQITK